MQAHHFAMILAALSVSCTQETILKSRSTEEPARTLEQPARISLDSLRAPSDRRRLTAEQAQLLVLNTPAALSSKSTGGCPEAELGKVFDQEGLAWLQVRNMCPKAGTGLINNFTVDLQNGEVWLDNRNHLIDSDQLKELRTKFLTQTR